MKMEKIMDKVGFIKGDTFFSLIGVYSGKNGKRGIGNKYRQLNYCSKKEGKMGNVFTCAESWLSFHPLKNFFVVVRAWKIERIES